MLLSGDGVHNAIGIQVRKKSFDTYVKRILNSSIIEPLKLPRPFRTNREQDIAVSTNNNSFSITSFSITIHYLSGIAFKVVDSAKNQEHKHFICV